ncbi:alpha-L-rhamnosidase-like protein [Novosphingobium sp. PhB165]|uniref:glycosyl hydrolase n=1 Tax=Novosphingobium sp. PhB165 TaxID=2485105 RepID=UPI00104E4A43|nr:glycosyl hydrolase [Novosphingobium sp. PhB165]TCM20676.1 alpha-L-rhamnosidase-like protein [Novosphingobium sp. PhB165]
MTIARSKARKVRRLALLLGAGIALLPISDINAYAQQAEDLEAGFRDPPLTARPRVWWHWMNGNITEDGIRKDIEWMARIGIGGMQSFDAAVVTPQIVAKRLPYMSPEWKHAFRVAAEEADKHGLELATASSPGWSETGGPWVKPADGMKKLVWSEMSAEGGKRFIGSLPPIPDTTGSFQDIPAQHMAFSPGQEGIAFPQYARDFAVLAFRIPGDWTPLPIPSVRVDDRPLDAAALNDGRYAQSVDILTAGSKTPSAVLIEYNKPRTIRSVTYQISGTTSVPLLEAEGEHGEWRKVAELPAGPMPSTASFAPVTAARFRLSWSARANQGGMLGQMGDMTPGVDIPGMLQAFGAKGAAEMMRGGASDRIRITELALQAAPRVNAFEQKAGFAIANDYYALDRGVGPEVPGIDPKDIVDLTGRMSPDGKLDWTPPAGHWKIVRLGYSLTGTMNHPATAEATGLEVDKYDGHAVRDYLQTYLDMYASATGDDLIGRRGLRAILTDSTEVGPSNWTADLVTQFKALRGYDPKPWFPALTGVIVGSRAQSDAFLYDFRRTLGDLMASQHYATIAQVAHERGLIYYGEALETSRVVLGDDMAMRRPTDIPMSMSAAEIDMRGAASVAHIYGQNLVAAESLTNALSPWATSPADLRAKMDFAFASGVNRPVIHTSVHQPVDDKQPGLALLIFGQYFNRHETWAEMAKPWIDYLARTAFLLQQGRDHSDLAYFYGEEAPLVGQFNTSPKDAPTRYGYDFVNVAALHDALKVEGKDLVTPGGARYRALYLGGTSDRMTVATLRRLAALANDGAIIMGHAPSSSPALGDDPREFAQLVKQLWTDGSGATVGKGQVIGTGDVEAALAQSGLAPDFSYTGAASDSKILFRHRTLPEGEIYFLTNRTEHRETGEARFRVTGKLPEIWRADTGQHVPVTYGIEDGQTVVKLDMAPTDAFFITFVRPATAQSASVPEVGLKPVKDIGAGVWNVDFQPGRGAPASTKLPRLASLSENDDPGIRYFSGIATYSKTFELPKETRPGQPLVLDLGKFGDIAEVTVNGHLAGTLWREPHTIDIGSLVKEGHNTLSVRVADRWVNRLIGDAQPGAHKVTWTSTPTYLPNAPLRPSGLIGPVYLLTPQ